MQHFQHSVLHAIRKCGICHVQWLMDNEEQEDYTRGRGILLDNFSYVECVSILY